MTLWTSKDICQSTHSSLCSRQDWSATGIAINSQDVQKGDLFVALKGERTDGHNYLEDAFARGAVAALVEYTPPTDHNFVVVRHTGEALLNIGRFARNRLHGTIVGVTGSAGKTSTKDMISLILGHFGKTFATRRSFNSKATVPLSLASADPDIDYGVFEIGMSNPGEIIELTQIVRPHIGVITNIGAAHLENFESIEGIAHEKASIFAGMASDGIAVIPGDSPYRSILVDCAEKQDLKTILLFGESEGCDCRLTKPYEQDSAYHYEAMIGKKKVSFSFPFPGKHWATNALIGLGIADALGLDLAEACERISQYQPPERRGVPTLLKNNILLIDESYNANPLSMTCAIEAFAARKVEGKKIAVLGDMRELGPEADQMHQDLQEALKKTDIKIVLTYGTHMKHLHQAISSSLEAYHFDSHDALNTKLLSLTSNNDAIMVKASLGTQFIKVIDALKSQYAPERSAHVL